MGRFCGRLSRAFLEARGRMSVFSGPLTTKVRSSRLQGRRPMVCPHLWVVELARRTAMKGVRWLLRWGYATRVALGPVGRVAVEATPRSSSLSTANHPAGWSYATRSVR